MQHNNSDDAIFTMSCGASLSYFSKQYYPVKHWVRGGFGRTYLAYDAKNDKPIINIHLR